MWSSLATGLLASAALLADPVLSKALNMSSSATVRWLGDTPSHNPGTTFGVPWPKGKYFPETTKFTASGSSHQPLEIQTWVTGHWADGSVKWTGHSIAASDEVHDEYIVTAATSGSNSTAVSKKSDSASSIVVSNSSDELSVDTGKVNVVFAKKGNVLVKSITTKKGKKVGQNGKLVLQSQSAIPDTFSDRGNTSVSYFNFESHIEDVSIERHSSIRALVTVKGKHQAIGDSSHDDWLPFVLRFYLYANSESIKIVHSLVFDVDAKKDFITGIGLQFDVPLKGEELYNRHVRISGVDNGLLNEAVKGITGLRRDPGEAVRAAQYDGEELPDESTWDTRVTSRLHWIPAWNDYSLTQLSPDGFSLKKRTKAGQSWVKIPGGTRSGGLAYLGGATNGGLAIGLRDFWKRYPTGLDISQAAEDVGSITLWLYSPSAQPLDLRPYHDGLGQDGYTDELDALEITYEDWESGFDTPYGIARTSEISLVAFDATPPRDELGAWVERINNPPVLITDRKYIRDTKALGEYWNLPETSNAKAEVLEGHLEFLSKYYLNSIEQRRWYGFLDYGDFMHTYDPDRHTWRYDIGGYAWDNSELSPDLFFWLYFLRTGREDAYRFAEALTRHTGEVDVYHIGSWKGLGTRHGVMHYSDSAKQARISQPQYRKYFYYISGGDERIGELLDELLDTDKTYGVLDPQRKVRTDGWKPTPNSTVAFGLGTDLGALAAGWLIAWERRGTRWEEAKTKLTNTLSGIAKLKNGFVTGSVLYDLQKWTVAPPPTDPDNKGIVAVSHLNAVFGLPEVVSEIIEYYGSDLPKGFKQAWLDYCYFYEATKAEQAARYGSNFGSANLFQGHSRLTAYYAHETGNSTVAKRAWTDFTKDGLSESSPWKTVPVNGSDVVIPVDEASWVSTNDVAQYGLAVIQNLAYVGDALS